MKDSRGIPNFLNAAVVAAQLLVVCACILACKIAGGWWWIAVAATFALTMNSVYFAIHEAMHGVLFSNKFANELAGTILSLFMPASFGMIRRVHQAHHIRNRSDDETFDVYFESDPAWWKKLQFYGILTGGFWLTMAISNLALALLPMSWISKVIQIDRPSEIFVQYVERHNNWRIRVEAAAIVVFHLAIILWLGPRAVEYAVMYAVFGMTWSTLQYVHHYGTCRDVLRGAKNLRYGRILDTLWLHHSWHLTHHLNPTASWRRLPELAGSDQQPTETLGGAYLKMWRGPMLTREHVKNRYEGRVGRS